MHYFQRQSANYKVIKIEDRRVPCSKRDVTDNGIVENSGEFPGERLLSGENEAIDLRVNCLITANFDQITRFRNTNSWTHHFFIKTHFKSLHSHRYITADNNVS